MCLGTEQINTEDRTTLSYLESVVLTDDMEMNSLSETVETKTWYSSLLELAADNDVERFSELIKDNPKAVDEVGLWYSRQVASRGLILEQRTPLMVAATYGSVDVLKVILSLSEADVNRTCSPDKSTALHFAASGGSFYAVDVVKLLVLAGADPNLADARGRRPFDVINVSRMLPQLRGALEELLTCDGSANERSRMLDVSFDGLKVDLSCISTASESKSLFCVSEGPKTSVLCKFDETNVSSASEKKEYPIDPSLPDIKDSIFATDEFRMYSFKVRPCSRAYSHDWTECPFVHPGENARRRDPRKYHYSCVPCPDFRKGSCRRGDLCEYAHGVFECWLHPAQYRTRLCKDGTNCSRRVCFFAHTMEELRPLYVSAGSVSPSPRSATSAAAVMDMAAALNFLPGSPSTAAGMSPSPFTPPMSPGNGTHSSAAWPQQNIPTLHLPGSNIQTNNLQASRLRSALNARDIPAEELSLLQDFDLEQQQILNDINCFSQPHFYSPSAVLSARSKTLTPSNLEGLFSSDSPSPRYSDLLAASPVFSPSQKSAVFNHFQQQQSMLSPINTKVFSPKKVDHPLLQAPFGASSPAMMSPQGIGSLSACMAALALREEQQQLRSLSSCDLGANLPRDPGPDVGGMVGSHGSPWSQWESSNGKPDWSVNGDEFDRLKRSYTIGHKAEEPDVSWVQMLVKESSSENKELQSSPVPAAKSSGEGSSANAQVETLDHSALGAWLDQLQLDQIVAQ